MGQSGATTLRDAIAKGNADSGEDLIVFDRSLFSTAQTITLNLGELDITHNLDIIAPRDSLTGGDLVTVSGKISRVFEIESGATVTLSGLIIANGTTNRGNINDSKGGGITNFGILTLDSSIVRNNRSVLTLTPTSSFGMGGGIYSTGTLKVSNSTISGNEASQTGGGIYSTGTITIQNSTISSNTVRGDGGGIYSTGTITIQNSTISGNSARTMITRSGTNRGSGGGISSNTTIIQNSTISGNSADGNGGGISGGAIIQNSTISGNSASQNGGGIYNDYRGTLTLLFSTVTQNQAANGGGVYQNDVQPFSTAIRGSLNVRNTIIASNLNSANGVNPDVSGRFSSNGYNLIGDGISSTGFAKRKGDIVGTSGSPIDPLLDVLASNGGPTQTIALLPGSPAINAADPTLLPTDPTTDQRGRLRTRRGRADIGAFESSLRK